MWLSSRTRQPMTNGLARSACPWVTSSQPRPCQFSSVSSLCTPPYLCNLVCRESTALLSVLASWLHICCFYYKFRICTPICDTTMLNADVSFTHVIDDALLVGYNSSVFIVSIYFSQCVVLSYYGWHVPVAMVLDGESHYTLTLVDIALATIII